MYVHISVANFKTGDEYGTMGDISQPHVPLLLLKCLDYIASRTRLCETFYDDGNRLKTSRTRDRRII